jgi:hypothetical protein
MRNKCKFVLLHCPDCEWGEIMVRYNYNHPLAGVYNQIAPPNPAPTLLDISTEDHADKLIAEFNIYGEGFRDRIIEHIRMAELRGEENAPIGDYYDYHDDL